MASLLVLVWFCLKTAPFSVRKNILFDILKTFRTLFNIQNGGPLTKALDSVYIYGYPVMSDRHDFGPSSFGHFRPSHLLAFLNPGYSENRIHLKPALGGVCSLAHYSVAYEETQSNRGSDFRNSVCSLFQKAILFYLFSHFSCYIYDVLDPSEYFWIHLFCSK